MLLKLIQEMIRVYSLNWSLNCHLHNHVVILPKLDVITFCVPEIHIFKTVNEFIFYVIKTDIKCNRNTLCVVLSDQVGNVYTQLYINIKHDN